jgi:hypothetical protein
MLEQPQESTVTVSLKDRLLAASLYLGAIPLFWFGERRRKDAFLAHHFAQSLGIFALLLAQAGLLIITIIVLSYTMVHCRGWYDAVHPEPHAKNILWKIFLAWLVFLGYGFALALLGSQRTLPLVVRLGRLRGLASLTACGMAGVYLLTMGIFPFAVHASRIARSDARPGQVYLLYEDINRFPRWLFTLGFYRISLAGRERFGLDSVVALRLSKDSVRRAVREGRFVFLGSHGMAQGLLLRDGFLEPQDVKAMQPNPGLQFVYMSGCDSGALKQAWEDAFAPANVVTYDRLTSLVEHVRWLWFAGPDVVRSLGDQNPHVTN